MSPDILTMPTEQDVIRQQIDESRSAMNEKLELLEGKVTETVQAATASVADATAAVMETVQNATASVSETVDSVNAAVQGTVENVRSSVNGAVDSVKETFDLTQQVRNYPWQMLAGAVALGYVGSHVFQPARRPTKAADQSFELATPRSSPSSNQRQLVSVTSANESDRSLASNNVDAQAAAFAIPTNPVVEPSPTWMGHLNETFGAEISNLRGLAIGASLGLVRDLITSSAPETLRTQIAEVVDGFTDKLGGQHIHGSVLQPVSDEVPSPNHPHFAAITTVL